MGAMGAGGADSTSNLNSKRQPNPFDTWPWLPCRAKPGDFASNGSDILGIPPPCHASPQYAMACSWEAVEGGMVQLPRLAIFQTSSHQVITPTRRHVPYSSGMAEYTRLVARPEPATLGPDPCGRVSWSSCGQLDAISSMHVFPLPMGL